jgi:hypothetical protein
MLRGLIGFQLLISTLFVFAQNKQLLPVKCGTNWGYIDTTGKITITPQYEMAMDFETNGYAKVFKDGKQGYVDLSGQEVLPAAYSYASIIRNDSVNNAIPYRFLFVHKTTSKIGLSDGRGNAILPEEWTDFMILKQILVRNENTTPDFVPIFFKNNIPVVSDIKMVNLKKYAPYYIYTNSDRKTGVMDLDGNRIISAEYDDIYYLGADLFFVKSQLSSGIINKNQQMLIDQNFDNVSPFVNHLSLVKYKGFLGLINDSGQVLLEPEFLKIDVLGSNIKARGEYKLVLLETDSLGCVEDKMVHTNVSTIYVRKQLEGRTDFTISQASGAAYTAPGWFYSEKNDRWGLINSAGDTIIKPRYAQVYSDKNSNVSMVQLEVKDSIVLFSIGYHTHAKFGIVDNNTGKIIIPCYFFHICIQDLLDPATSIVRCMNELGQWGYLDKQEYYKFTRVVFIDKIGPDMFRVVNKGRVRQTWRAVNERYVIVSRNDLLRTFTDFIPPNNQDPCVIYSKSAVWYYMKGNQKGLSKLQYAGKFYQNRAIIKKNKKWGVINDSMQIIVPNQYDSITIMPQSDSSLFLLINKNKKVGLINKEGTVLTDMIYDNILQSSEGFMVARKKPKYGYLDERGNEISKFIYRNARKFSEGLAAVNVGGKWGYIDTTGNMILNPEFIDAYDFGDGWAYVRQNHKYGFINSSGNMMLEFKSETPAKFTHGVAWVRVKNKFGLINKSGKWIIRPRYTSAMPFDENGFYSIVGKGRRVGIVDYTGKVIVPVKNDKIIKLSSDAMAIFSDNNKYGFLNEKCEKIVSPKYSAACNFHDGYALVENENYYTIINKNGDIAHNLQRVLPGRFTKDSLPKFTSGELIQAARDQKTLVRDTITSRTYNVVHLRTEGNKYILIDNTEKNMSLELMIVCKNYINKFQVRNYTQSSFDYIAALGDRVAKYRNNNVYGVADRNGSIIFEPRLEGVSYMKNGIYKIVYRNQTAYLRKNGSWIWKPATN